MFDPLNFKRKHNIKSGHNSILEVIGSFVGFFFPQAGPLCSFQGPPPSPYLRTLFFPLSFCPFFLSSGGWALFLSSPWEIECTRNGGRGGGERKRLPVDTSTARIHYECMCVSFPRWHCYFKIYCSPLPISIKLTLLTEAPRSHMNRDRSACSPF